MFLRHAITKAIISFVIFLTIAAIIGIVFLLQSKQHIITYVEKKAEEVAATPTPFPVSVDPTTKTIIENPIVENYFTESLATAPRKEDNWWNQVAAVFNSKGWYQNLASPVGRIIVIWPGERKEEAAKNIGDVLGWDKEDRLEFQKLVDATEPATLTEGKYFPGQYVAHRGATPADIQAILTEAFQKDVLGRYSEEVAAKVSLSDALIIASLLEREASDFENMREISGVIWNRLFTDMPLQLDATLQYVKGSNPNQSKWWPVVRPADKYLKSPYNTYKNKGLPPAPIANPSAEAILAALNPVITDCMYYFHTRNKTYHCSPTYEEHVAKLRSIYGRGS
ncbi:MAG: endolytic transglycosylase MltG [Candidatus Pacebacteria bacterium]|nr:endolytic transglycosylase MltG [Candidatus Paceibacterota bacterium]